MCICAEFVSNARPSRFETDMPGSFGSVTRSIVQSVDHPLFVQHILYTLMQHEVLHNKGKEQILYISGYRGLKKVLKETQQRAKRGSKLNRINEIK